MQPEHIIYFAGGFLSFFWFAYFTYRARSHYVDSRNEEFPAAIRADDKELVRVYAAKAIGLLVLLIFFAFVLPRLVDHLPALG